MFQLTKLQIKILAEASASPEEAFTAPESGQRAIAALVRQGLLAVMPDEAGPTRLKITPSGREALAAESMANAEPNGQIKRPRDRAPMQGLPSEPTPARRAGKIEMIIALLNRPDGASIEAMMAATGWLGHSVRGALSGAIKKGRGLQVASERIEGVRIYRLAGGQG